MADGLVPTPADRSALLKLEHASGTIDVTVDFDITDGAFDLCSAGFVRTARLLAKGHVIVPKAVRDPQR